MSFSEAFIAELKKKSIKERNFTWKMMPQKLFSDVQYFAFVVVKMLSVFWGSILTYPIFYSEKINSPQK